MKSKLKPILIWLVECAVCFAVIYLVVFFSGAKLFESSDPVLIILGCALILSLFVSVILRAMEAQSKRIDALEARVKTLEATTSEKTNTPDNES